MRTDTVACGPSTGAWGPVRASPKPTMTWAHQSSRPRRAPSRPRSPSLLGRCAPQDLLRAPTADDQLVAREGSSAEF